MKRCRMQKNSNTLPVDACVMRNNTDKRYIQGSPLGQDLYIDCPTLRVYIDIGSVSNRFLGVGSIWHESLL